MKGLMEVAKLKGDGEKAVAYAEEIAGLSAGETGGELDVLSAVLDQKESLAEELIRPNSKEWERNIAGFFSGDDEGIIEIDKIEEESLIFDSLPDIAGEVVPILDSGGIEPVISGE